MVTISTKLQDPVKAAPAESRPGVLEDFRAFLKERGVDGYSDQDLALTLRDSTVLDLLPKVLAGLSPVAVTVDMTVNVEDMLTAIKAVGPATRIKIAAPYALNLAAVLDALANPEVEASGVLRQAAIGTVQPCW
jgi:hypothetical protein